MVDSLRSERESTKRACVCVPLCLRVFALYVRACGSVRGLETDRECMCERLRVRVFEWAQVAVGV